MYSVEGLLTFVCSGMSCAVQMPGTPHYVVSLENAIAFGQSFYSASTILDSCYAFLHCAILNPTVTNTNHFYDCEALLLRIWYYSYLELMTDGLYLIPFFPFVC